MRYLLHDVFTNSVDQFPQNTAILEEDGNSVTYEDLNKRTNQYSHYFASCNPDIQSQPFVGILSPVHIESIAACLGILKLGGAYIPLDESSPDSRLASIVDNTKLDTIVIDAHQYEAHAELLNHSGIKNVLVLGVTDALQAGHSASSTALDSFSQENPPLLNQVSDDLAYILHSSGSTGVPKGIMLTHRNARTFVDWMHKEFQVTADDVIMSRAPFKFDLSVFDIFNTFKAGATLVCYNWNRSRAADTKHADYVRLMEESKATILYTTPSTFISLMNRGGLTDASLHLREIMYAGEPFATPQLRKLRACLPKVRIANIYGPTETNIITYYWIDELPEDDAAIPLGHTVEDTEIIIVSEDGSHICAPDELGELWCRGGTVTLGYLGLPDKTNASLVQSPFHKYPVFFWRTGDFGLRDKNGILHYRGRKDHMVKVLGYRIELGEIESALAKIANIDEFAVVAIPDEKYGNRLHCFYSALPNQSLTESDVRDFLSTQIPTYMIPFKFYIMEPLPKTSSGKVDRILLTNQILENQS